MSPIDPALRISSVTLGVSDLARSADFYERVLGLAVQARDEQRAVLAGGEARSTLVLEQLAPAARPAPASATGLYHVAWLHPSRAGLADTVRRIAQGGWRFDGASDHGVSEALYLSDPDGLGIEVYADRPRERWGRDPEGAITMYTLPLDLEDLLAQGSESPGEAIEPATSIGHVHLKVADVARSSGYYGDTLGFEQMARLPAAAFVAAGGYHHHVGLNSWQSAGSGPPPVGAPGLRVVEFELPAGAVDRLEEDLGGEAERRDGVLFARDPDGQQLAFAGRGQAPA